MHFVGVLKIWSLYEKYMERNVSKMTFITSLDLRSTYNCRFQRFFTYLHVLKSVCFYLQTAYDLLFSARNRLASSILRTDLRVY